MTYRVRFLPDDLTIEVPAGTSLMEAARRLGIELKSSCGGQGTCGRCAVFLRRGEPEILQGNPPRRLSEQGGVLACRVRVTCDLLVEVPEWARVVEHQVVVDAHPGRLLERDIDWVERFGRDPVCRRQELRLPAPTLTDNASDATRLSRALAQQVGKEPVHIPIDVLRGLPERLRSAQWCVDVTWSAADGPARVVDLRPPGEWRTLYGVAVDLGTTSVVVQLVDLESGALVGERGTYNRQFKYGDDVISRIIHCAEHPGGVEELRTAVVETANHLIRQLLREASAAPEQVVAAAVAGNTTMEHLFLGIDPRYIRLEPYIPAVTRFPYLEGRDVGLEINPHAAVIIIPAVASYVGGDVVAGALIAGLAECEEVTLFIDVGTNGEMVLGNRDWLVACACSAGPCFEGGGITHGMRAVPGAIQSIRIDPETFVSQVVTVGGAPPRGICGSGLVECLSELHRVGLINRAGEFQDVPSAMLRSGEAGPEFVLVPREAAGVDEDIVITEADVKNLIRAKGAIFAGIRSLLKAVDLSPSDISRIWIAGGFGTYLNLQGAVRIGMLPDVDRSRYGFLGNSSVKGARTALLSRRAREAMWQLAERMTYLELSVGPGFMEEFVSALFIPHTNLDLFPSVTADGNRGGESNCLGTCP